MAKQLFSNNATATLASGITNVATSLTVATGKGALFSAPTTVEYELLTITDFTNYEIVKVTGRSGDVLTIVRGQESTTARSWSAGATISGYVTKGTLEALRNQGSGTNAVAIGSAGSATNSGSIAIGPSTTSSGQWSIAIGDTCSAQYDENISIGRLSSTNSNGGAIAIGASSNAQGAYSTAVGRGTFAGNTNATAVGVGASSQAAYSVALGSNSSATTAYSIAIGDLAAAQNQQAIALGAGSTTKGVKGLSIGYSAKSANFSSIALGDNSLAGPYTGTIGIPNRANSTFYATGDVVFIESVAIYFLYCVKEGTSGSTPPSVSHDNHVTDGTVVWWSVVTQGNNMSLGSSSTAISYSCAIGPGSAATGNQSLAIGPNASARKYASTALGTNSTTHHERSLTILGSTSMADNAVHTSKLPYLGAPPSWWTGWEYREYCSFDGYVQSEPIDLAGGATWTASTVVKHGYAVKPSTPNGYQYIRYCINYNPWDSPRLDYYAPGSTGATEPTWPTLFADSAADGDGDWICIPHDGTYVMDMPVGAHMLVSEVGFIAYDALDITAQPYISIGTGGADLTSLVNNQQTSGLTSTMSVYRWSLIQPKLVQHLSIKIDTLATGTRLLGRFYFKGVLTKHWV